MQVDVSEGVRRACAKAPARAEWLRALPALVGEMCERWDVAIEQSFDGATCSFVAGGRTRRGARVVLKLGMPHFEGTHEIDGLLFWDGDPTVRVLESDRERHAMLLEHCDSRKSLESRSKDEQDTVIAGLLRRLWRTPTQSHAFRPLSEMIAQWCEESLDQANSWTDPMLVKEGLDMFAELARSDSRHVLLATDLHARNVLQAQREPWLVIDPKPFVGDPAYDATQHLLNCSERLHSDPLGTVIGFADLLGVHAQRVRGWLFARLAAEPRDDWSDTESIDLARKLAP